MRRAPMRAACGTVVTRVAVWRCGSALMLLPSLLQEGGMRDAGMAVEE